MTPYLNWPKFGGGRGSTRKERALPPCCPWLQEICKLGHEFHILNSFYNTKKSVIAFVHTDTTTKQIVAEYLMNSILVAKIETVSRCVFWHSYKTLFRFKFNFVMFCGLWNNWYANVLRCCSSHVWMISSSLFLFLHVAFLWRRREEAN